MSLCTNFKRILESVNSLFKRFIFESSVRETQTWTFSRGLFWSCCSWERLGSSPTHQRQAVSSDRFSFLVTEAQTTTGSRTNTFWRSRLMTSPLWFSLPVCETEIKLNISLLRVFCNQHILAKHYEDEKHNCLITMYYDDKKYSELNAP